MAAFFTEQVLADPLPAAGVLRSSNVSGMALTIGK